ncbi:uncharacterized protein LOC119661829 isoform X2 [Teleopsis dalmanni]|uniref:uncharacterized protein LOC119661829 isoform X2 n=1 Tax=Teleopsis dalmanni TaxID=139649 RepID=UPI0018CE959E|nr:uncharacterized protein LOC119661829 isoform X2 [Teleopsis dalmanni]
MLQYFGAFLISILFLQDCTHSLRLLEVRIPNYVIKGSAAQLECLYDLDGEALYSVKWYKDGNEFYRYVPRDMPPAQTFLLPGVSVDLHNSSDAIVTLRNVNLQTAGRFRCEVSGEAPSFQTVTEHSDMIVVSLPDQGPPKISGGRPRYQIGDWVRINCTAGRSKPAVQLSWFVNGEPAEPNTLRKYDTMVSGREGLETSILGLQFRVEQHHFRNGDMKLKCVASLSTFYWRSNEESVEGDRPQKAPVLESRETVYASNSRADPVQAASKTDSVIVANAPSFIVLLLAATIATGCLEQLHLWQQLLVQQLLRKRVQDIKKLRQQRQKQQQHEQQQQQQQQQQLSAEQEKHETEKNLRDENENHGRNEQQEHHFENQQEQEQKIVQIKMNKKNDGKSACFEKEMLFDFNEEMPSLSMSSLSFNTASDFPTTATEMSSLKLFAAR